MISLLIPPEQGPSLHIFILIRAPCARVCFLRLRRDNHNPSGFMIFGSWHLVPPSYAQLRGSVNCTPGLIICGFWHLVSHHLRNCAIALLAQTCVYFIHGLVFGRYDPPAQPSQTHSSPRARELGFNPILPIIFIPSVKGKWAFQTPEC